MAIDLDQLERKARAATPGPYKTRAPRNCLAVIVVAGTEQIADAGENTHWTDTQSANNAEYIAAASPDVVLRLINRLRVYETYVSQLLAELDAGENLGDVRPTIEMLRQQLVTP